MRATKEPLYGLDNDPVPIQDVIQLEVMLGTYPKTASKVLTFLVMDLPSVYNAIFRRPYLTAFNVVTSIPYQKIKFLTPFGIGEVIGDQAVGWTRYLSQVIQSLFKT
ncbi:hypothetical protein Nepgr_015301 [Nepenthes gracilis]|uniref:Uncharacterized protein n=1 Tax=Nepenthes gracilis TaxID=150966 RepID=A0AAD3SKS4_NEPGR|nr:hypothetical protein Nepgr_015301 [Nepenthes gracilis]